MSDPKAEAKLNDQISDEELKAVQGGNRVDPITLLPNYIGPKVGQTYGKGSISQGEINVADPSADDNNLPD
jgi:hypothetical protein